MRVEVGWSGAGLVGFQLPTSPLSPPTFSHPRPSSTQGPKAVKPLVEMLLVSETSWSKGKPVPRNEPLVVKLQALRLQDRQLFGMREGLPRFPTLKPLAGCFRLHLRTAQPQVVWVHQVIRTSKAEGRVPCWGRPRLALACV